MSNTTRAIPAPAVTHLNDSVTGQVIRPGDATYDEHRRTWNGSIDRTPALIIRCAGTDDVRTAVRFAADRGLLIAVRGGGHSFPGLSTCDGGIVIDLSLMNQIDVDPDNRTARVGAGALLGDVDRATQPFGLGVPAGIVSHTGVAGLTLGGGLGWQQRKYGLTIDNLLSAEVVTAAGDVVVASAEQNAELFWGLRGGGGNFGVVTSFLFRLNPIGPDVMAGAVFWPMEDSERVLRFYRDWVANSPDEVTTIVFQRRLPDRTTIPRALVGKGVMAIAACYTGPVEEGAKALRPLKSFGSPLADMCEPKPFLIHQSMFDDSYRHGGWYYVKACDVAELSDEVIGTVVEHGGRVSSLLSSVAIWQMGGAVSRVDENDTAFPGRKAGFTFNISGNTESAAGFETERQWARDYWSALSPHHTGVYVNFLMDEGEDRIRHAYGAAKLARLRSLKRTFDPTNLFRLNQNIIPA